jgi:hypothetical protein
MAKRRQDCPETGAAFANPPSLMPILLGCLLTITFAGCGGGGSQALTPPAGQPNPLLITPAFATVVEGQTAVFTTNSTTGNVTWAVVPGTGGSINAAGTFTASSSVGQVQILARWSPADSGILTSTSAAATVSVVVPPLPAVSSSSYAQASGTQQAANGTTLTNASVVGEAFPASLAASANQSEQLRDGFLPPEPATTN